RVPRRAASLRCEVEERPQGFEVCRTARVLAWIGHLAAHLSAPEMADFAIATREDAEAGDVGIVGADVGAGVVAFRIGVERQVAPAAFFFEVEHASNRGARCDSESDTVAQVSGSSIP